jgi:hypothetical protein
MTRASGSTTPRWTLTMVVVVKASMIPLNSTVSLRVDDSAGENEPRGNYCDFFSGWAINPLFENCRLRLVPSNAQELDDAQLTKSGEVSIP